MFKSDRTTSSYDITDIGHVERIIIGSTEPDTIPTTKENQLKIDKLNAYLQTSPRGRIIGTERSFSLVRIGEHQVVLEAVAYHIGFKRKPSWIKPNAQKVELGPEIDLCEVEKVIQENR